MTKTLMALLILCLLITDLHAQKKSKSGVSKSAVVTMTDGSVYKVAQWKILTGKLKQSNSYSVYPDFSSKDFPLYCKKAVRFVFPLERIATITITHKASTWDDEAHLTLIDSTKITGLPWYYSGGKKRYLTRLDVRSIDHGFASSFFVTESDVENITISRTKQGKISPTIKKTDGTVVSSITQLEFRFDGDDSRGEGRPSELIFFEVEGKTLEIPTADLVSLTRITEKQPSREAWVRESWLIGLHSGNTLTGKFACGHHICGETFLSGTKAYFEAWISNMQSVILK